ncbi:thioredoxin domain-containing protein [bacterium]|jgi:protein-disulfide isomerase|nr:thioredoxin domain-containing protein [bacterium]MBT4334918.1 thioredoxin domain-containing protein [bacterium]MBT4495768.1 thioredoxin domain-containing protein [bacterium]MBT4763482.1 thioredoxin domain-containing protein [bacterium]MBT5400853.1 thioredoxin domain-containing protein [bacterium]
MFNENKKKKGFFDLISAKSSFILGLVGGVLIVGTIGFLITLSGSGSGFSLPLGDKTEYNENSLAYKLDLDMKDFKECLDSDKYVEKVNAEFQEGSAAGVTGTPGVYVNEYLVRGAYPYEVFTQIIDSILAGQEVNIEGVDLPTSGYSNVKEITKDDNYLGNLDAQVKLVEFSDFQCPYCARAHPTLKRIIEDYGDQVVWVYKHYPLDQLHPYARGASESAECAGEQDMFWEYTDALYENQSLITSDYINY